MIQTFDYTWPSQKITIQGYAKDPQLKRKVNAFKTDGLLSSNGIETYITITWVKKCKWDHYLSLAQADESFSASNHLDQFSLSQNYPLQ